MSPWSVRMGAGSSKTSGTSNLRPVFPPYLIEAFRARTVIGLPPCAFFCLILAFAAFHAWLAASPASAMDVTIRVSSFHMDFGLPHAPENLLDGDHGHGLGGRRYRPGQGPVDRAQLRRAHAGGQGWVSSTATRPRDSSKISAASGPVRIVYPDGIETQFWLRDEPGEQVVECRARPFKSLRIVVDDVFPKGDDDCQEKAGRLRDSSSTCRSRLLPAATPRKTCPRTGSFRLRRPWTPTGSCPTGIMDAAAGVLFPSDQPGPGLRRAVRRGCARPQRFSFRGVQGDAAGSSGTYRLLRTAQGGHLQPRFRAGGAGGGLGQGAGLRRLPGQGRQARQESPGATPPLSCPRNRKGGGSWSSKAKRNCFSRNWQEGDHSCRPVSITLSSLLSMTELQAVQR